MNGNVSDFSLCYKLNKDQTKGNKGREELKLGNKNEEDEKSIATGKSLPQNRISFT